MSPHLEHKIWLSALAVIASVGAFFGVRTGHVTATENLREKIPPPPMTAAGPMPSASTGTTPLRLPATSDWPITRATAAHQWVADDCKDTNVIRKLAHNPLEYQRLVEENSRIIRRQLVLCQETAAALIQRARLSGEPVRQLTLPGLDGQELPFEITQSELNPSGQQGTFMGHLAGRLDSTVSFAFKGGREAFTIISPATGLYLVGEPHEPGELIVKSIDPETYVVGVCGNP